MTTGEHISGQVGQQQSVEHRNPPLYSSSADDIKGYVNHLNAQQYPDHRIDNEHIDKLFFGTGIVSMERKLFGARFDTGSAAEEAKARMRDLDTKHPNESSWAGGGEGIWTPYNLCRNFMQTLDIDSSHTFEDWGAGWGRVVLYAGITATAKCRGIELVGERVAKVREAIDKLELDNTEFIEAKIQDHDYTQADVIHMYLPFSQPTFRVVHGMIEDLTTQKPLTIVNRGSNIDTEMSQGRLQNLQFVKQDEHFGAKYYETKDIAFTPESRIKGPLDFEKIAQHNRWYNG
jgi:16S rRNA G527 N7-methylase RsmG